MSDFQTTREVRARVPHRCRECSDRIAPGETYVRGAGSWEGDFYDYKICTLCDRAWAWVWRELDPDPEWTGIGGLVEYLQESRDVAEHGIYVLRLATYVRRRWRRADGSRFPFPPAPVGASR